MKATWYFLPRRNMQINYVSNKEIKLHFDKIGYVKLSKFSPDFDYGIYRNRPWHVTTFGRNFATVEECLLFLKEVEDNWDKSTIENSGISYTGYGANTHAPSYN